MSQGNAASMGTPISLGNGRSIPPNQLISYEPDDWQDLTQ